VCMCKANKLVEVWHGVKQGSSREGCFGIERDTKLGPRRRKLQQHFGGCSVAE
jgi:hypothetical protein